MQDYFRHATQVGELTRILLTALESQHLKREPLLQGLFKRRRKVRAPFVVNQGRLSVASEEAFLADKLNMLRVFEEALRTGLLLHPDAMRLVAAHLDLIDDEVRSDKEAARIFIDLLIKHGNPERVAPADERDRRARRLHPRVRADRRDDAVQHVSRLHGRRAHHPVHPGAGRDRARRAGRASCRSPSKIIKEGGINRKVLYLAVFCHDIGKGRVEDHSILGAKIARPICPRLGLSKEDTATVEWLVRSHLLMSDVAQKRDLSDPRTVNGFAKAVGTKKRLDLLLVLTVCDIRGVGPNTWNNWKATLLRDLYRQTRVALEDGIEALSTGAADDRGEEGAARGAADWDKKDLRAETARHYDPYWQGLWTSRSRHLRRASASGISEDEIRIELTADNDRDATRASFALADHPGIFSRLAGALALVGANVVDARTYTSKDGWATPVFWVQDHEGTALRRSQTAAPASGMIDKTLKGEVVPRDAMRDRDKLKKRERAFKVPTNIIFDNEGSEIYTIVEVDTRDRPGLLYDLTRTPRRQQRADRLRGDRDLRRTGGRHLLRQGHVRVEVPQRDPA